MGEYNNVWWPMEVPYLDSPAELVLEPGCIGQMTLEEALARLTPVEEWLDEDKEVAQILIAGLALWLKGEGEYRLADCIDTATIWSHG